ncbi:MAG: FadR family transcriptional regulator [Desulfobacterales bacterium]|nr:FadR family transcriptional regulator [Desulfobacterales bacterium]
MQKHEIVVKRLVTEIFNNKLQPGQKLPTERRLSVLMGVDRTSLRVALKQLESMQLLDIRQGDGIYVRDYKKFAGIDFLRMMLSLEEEDIDSFVGEYLIEEIWNFWMEFMPLMIRMAMAHATPMALKQFVDVFDAELENLDDREKIVELEVLSQEMIAQNTGNLLVLLLSNSTRQMRLQIVRRFIGSMQRDEIKTHVEYKRALIRGYMTGTIQDPNLLAEGQRSLLKKHWEAIRGTWQFSKEEGAIVHQVLSTPGDEKKVRRKRGEKG